jgi:glycine betaine/proline transport system substrate-binding protein
MNSTIQLPQDVAGPGGSITLQDTRSAENRAPNAGLRRRRAAAVALSAVIAIALAGCGGDKVEGSASTASPGAAASKAPCGAFNLAVNPWVGYEADAAVVTYLAEKNLGCTVNQKKLAEQVSWQGFATGQVDVILENWGYPDLQKKYVDEDKVAQVVGQTGNFGKIGWYVPPWMAKKYPDITDWKTLNKYANLFKTSESGDKGQFLEGDPSYKTFDAALIKNLNLNYKVLFAGSEAALIVAFKQAEAKQTPLLGYFYVPQVTLAEVPLVRIDLPKYTPGCEAQPAKVACDYAENPLTKIASTKFMSSGSPAVSLIKNFNWTNDDQTLVAKYIQVDKLSDDAAAKKWVDANPDKVKAWLATS